MCLSDTNIPLFKTFANAYPPAEAPPQRGSVHPKKTARVTAGVTHSGTEATRLIVKSGEQSAPCGCTLHRCEAQIHHLYPSSPLLREISNTDISEA